jgi:hypothetical protein
MVEKKVNKKTVAPHRTLTSSLVGCSYFVSTAFIVGDTLFQGHSPYVGGFSLPRRVFSGNSPCLYSY